MTIEELLEEFEFLQDWEDRCDFLIDLGFELPGLPDAEKTEENLVHGCQSRVWLIVSLDESQDPPTIHIRADSEAMIVRGLIAVLLAIYEGRPVDAAAGTDVQSLFEQLGLNTHLSATRRNGLYGMVERIQEFARQHAPSA